MHPWHLNRGQTISTPRSGRISRHGIPVLPAHPGGGSGNAHSDTHEPSKPKDNWDRAAILMPVVQALLLVAIGYYSTGKLSNALQQKQVDLSNVKEMQAPLSKLWTDGTPSEAE